MFTMKHATILALVGSTFAVPLARRDGPYGGRLPGNFGFNEGTVVVTDPPTTTVVEETVTTITVFPDGSSGFVPQPVVPAPQPAVPSAAPVVPVVPSAPAASPTSTGSSGGTDDYMSIVNKYRSAGGLPDLTESSQLQANALKTVTDSHGSMVHELNPGSMAQVLAPGNANDFEKVYVGGWLCEIPSLPGINCGEFDAGWAHNGETGHAKILTNTAYSKIGCALNDGIWGCDLA